MERNWLIRTSQNQILGPVSKVKVVEFIQKGALGLTDEISSGNGYWIGIKERDLLEKYVFGDMPQSYNPISEAKTVLANKEHPNQTRSLNLSPANIKTATINEKSKEDVVLPKNDDLEFPDMESVVKSIDNEDDVTRISIPNNSDLEFPDLNAEQIDDDTTRVVPVPIARVADSDEIKFEVPQEYKAHKSPETKVDLILPNKDDLEFPDTSAIMAKVDGTNPDFVRKGGEFVINENTSTKIDPSSALNLELDFTRTVALKDMQSREILDGNDQGKEHVPNFLKPDPNKKINLHERKGKTATRKSATEQRDPRREQIYSKIEPTQTKKRNDTYLFFILFLLIIIILAVFYYFKEILNKPFPV